MKLSDFIGETKTTDNSFSKIIDSPEEKEIKKEEEEKEEFPEKYFIPKTDFDDFEDLNEEVKNSDSKKTYFEEENKEEIIEEFLVKITKDCDTDNFGIETKNLTKEDEFINDFFKNAQVKTSKSSNNLNSNLKISKGNAGNIEKSEKQILEKKRADAKIKEYELTKKAEQAKRKEEIRAEEEDKYKRAEAARIKKEEEAIRKAQERAKAKKEAEEKDITKNKAEELFLKSETDLKYKDKWMITYEKALSTPEKKRNYVINKCIRGRFTIKDDKIELLPELDIFGKSSADLLKMDWKLS